MPVNGFWQGDECLGRKIYDPLGLEESTSTAQWDFSGNFSGTFFASNKFKASRLRASKKMHNAKISLHVL